jgi:hypothetical protein
MPFSTVRAHHDGLWRDALVTPGHQVVSNCRLRNDAVNDTVLRCSVFFLQHILRYTLYRNRCSRAVQMVLEQLQQLPYIIPNNKKLSYRG